MALCLGLPGWTGTRRVKPIWILLKQETVSGSGIGWAMCKPAPRSWQITMPAPRCSVFYRPDALHATQPAVSKHWRHCHLNQCIDNFITHTHPFNGPFSGTTRVSRYQKGKTNLDLLKQETVSGSGISWVICKSAPCSKQITTPAPHRSVFYRLDALPAAQPTVSKHWRDYYTHIRT